MSQVTQTICVGQLAGVHGNCLQAAIASHFDLPLDAVPHFAHFDELWLRAVSLWCAATGRGTVEHVGVARIPPDATVVLLGRSPRGVLHCVVRREGVVWDPHPSRAGLTEVIGALVFDYPGPVVGEARR